MISALLALEDGTIFSGKSIGVNGETFGEVVFNTAMTGYQEILTDPSYFKQLVTLTYPHIGNTGVNESDFESSKAFASGLIIRDLSSIASSWRKENDLGSFLKQQKIIAIADIDTRMLTNHIRSNGSLRGCISNNELDQQSAVKKALKFPGLSGMDLAKSVTTNTVYTWNKGHHNIYEEQKETMKGHFHVVAYDFGIKENILRLLVDQGCMVTVVPAMTTAKEVLSMKPDGVFLSNGPGDPEPCVYAIESIQKLLQQKIPIFGICLGHQLLALASGAKKIKMKFGHHGANHPVQDLKTGKVLISSQNHSFTVDESTLPDTINITHRSLFDQSLQGIEFKDLPAFSFQGHPEASPGPHDLSNLFDQFTNVMKRCQNDKI